MRALAEFIMAGRSKAALVAFGGSLLPLVSPAAVALVALRRGLPDGALMMLWALLPLVLILYVGDGIAPVMIWASVATVPVVLFAAGVLGGSSSWPRTLMAAVVLSGLSALAMKLLLVDDLEASRVTLTEMFKQIQQGQTTFFVPSDVFVLGMLAWIVALGAIGSLLLARWWQSLLYNPGGFRQEFHALRMERPLAVLLLVGMAVCYLLPRDYMTWGNLIGLPLLLGGIALVHHAVLTAQLGMHWLVIFYVCLLLVAGPMTMLLAGIGFLDSIMDLRSRLATRRGNSD